MTGFTVKVSKYESINRAFIDELIKVVEGSEYEEYVLADLVELQEGWNDNIYSLTLTKNGIFTFQTKNDRKDYVLPGAFDQAVERAEEFYNPEIPAYPTLSDLNEEALEKLGFDHWQHALNAVKKALRQAWEYGQPADDRLTVWNCPADLVYKVAEIRGDGPGLNYELRNPSDYNL